MSIIESKSMNQVTSISKQCDECGKYVEKVKRVYRGHRYCSTCYVRVFKPIECPKCGEQAKLPKNVPSAVCSSCEKDKPCVRCGREPKYAIGKMTPYGPVCNACSVYFREAEPCENCCTYSKRLSRCSRQGHDKRLCPKCIQADFATCIACRKYRLLKPADDGRMLCKACLEHRVIPCPECHQPMAAGYGKCCDDCQWLHTFKRRLAIDQAAFSSPIMQTAFRDFGAWLLLRVGSRKSALTIHRYLKFFQDVEEIWGRFPSYVELICHFGAEGLRRVRLPMAWLSETKGGHPDIQMREDSSDWRRIREVISSVPAGTQGSRILSEYYEFLLDKFADQRISVRSIRLALRPAVSLLLESDPIGLTLPNQADLDRYLLDAPGQKAAVSGFIRFLRERYQLRLLLRVDLKRVAANRRKKLEGELLAVMREAGEGEEFLRRWLSLALAYFHGLPLSVGKMTSVHNLTHAKGGVSVAYSGARYWVPLFLKTDKLDSSTLSHQ